MGTSFFKAAASGALLIMASTPALAAPSCWSTELVQAAKLRQLDVLLMVGSLRCRSGAQDYRAAYDQFLMRHRPMLGKVNQGILNEMRAKLGPIGALEALDQASVRMANHYGEQAAFGCGDLGQVTAALAQSGDDALAAAADVLVGGDVALEGCPVTVAVATVPGLRR
ncbi:MAG: S-adenosyl-L-homocysteine hydrolase [Novosphingobium sp.]